MEIPKKGFRLAEDIINNVCDEYGISRKDIVAKRQSRTLAAARKEAIQRIADQTEMSLIEIGKLFRRHPSAIHAALYGRKAKTS